MNVILQTGIDVVTVTHELESPFSNWSFTVGIALVIIGSLMAIFADGFVGIIIGGVFGFAFIGSPFFTNHLISQNPASSAPANIQALEKEYGVTFSQAPDSALLEGKDAPDGKDVVSSVIAADNSVYETVLVLRKDDTLSLMIPDNANPQKYVPLPAVK